MGIAAFKGFLRQLKYRGFGRVCPVCNKASRCYAPFGVAEIRQDAKCIHCGSLERHRLLMQFMTRFTDLFDGRAKRVLHIAPEECLERVFRRTLGEGYLTADLFDARADVRMDITDIHMADDTLDVVYCNHVLEHVPDDRKAMRELCRILKPTGWAVLNVPVDAARTYEDPSVTDPREREKHFGQSDHVRRYGPDYVDRLEESGFRVKTFGVPDIVGARDAERIGVADNALATGKIYFCTRRKAGPPVRE